MKILVTGAAGFVGKNLCERLKCIRDGKDRTTSLKDIEIFEYDIDSSPELLERYCGEADFVFNLAGVNRPENSCDFMRGNSDFADELLNALEKHENNCPVMLASSVQATLAGIYADGEYGKSKKAGEELFFKHAEQTGAKVLVYRFPNLYGKWCRPNYNSVVATFCYNIAHSLPIKINDHSTVLELLYIDDLVDEMISALEGREHHCEFDGIKTVFKDDGKFCAVPSSTHVTLGELADMIESFGASEQNTPLILPEMPENSFIKKLYSTYLSYLPREKVSIPLKMNTDVRGNFTELLRTEKCGQLSVNISNPGITKGEHWHNTKWEFFIVVSGHGLIEQRKIGTDEVLSFEVSGEKLEAVHMLPGYTHNLINLSDTEKLITVMWANECFDPNKPDTFGEPVNKK